MARPKTYDPALRARLINVAAADIAEHGFDGLSIRRIALGAETSTSAVYAFFGGRDGLVAAVIQDAFDSFGSAQAKRLGGSEPVNTLFELGRDYRRWALENPHLYAVMFSARGGGATVTSRGMADQQGETEEISLVATRAMQPLVAVLTELAAAGRLVDDDVAAAARSIWSSVHGAVALELVLWPSQDDLARERAYETVLAATQRAWILPTASPAEEGAKSESLEGPVSPRFATTGQSASKEHP